MAFRSKKCNYYTVILIIIAILKNSYHATPAFSTRLHIEKQGWSLDLAEF